MKLLILIDVDDMRIREGSFSSTFTIPNTRNGNTFTTAGLSRMFNETIPNITSWITHQTQPLLETLNLPERLFDITLISGLLATPLPNEAEEEINPQDARLSLISSPSRDFPFVNLIDLSYNTRTDRIYLALSRNSENAPIPSKDFFDSIKVRNTTLNFADSTSRTFSDPDSESNPYRVKAREYSWSLPSSPIPSNSVRFPITLVKQGVSKASQYESNRMITKSTIESREDNEYPNVVNGFSIKSIDYTSTSLTIVFNDSNLTSISSIAIKDKENEVYITRQLLPSDATITGNALLWEDDFPEFKELQLNKEYNIEIITNASETENRFFVPNPSGDYHYLKDLTKTGTEFSFNLVSNGSEALESNSFNTFRLENEDGSQLTPHTQRHNLSEDSIDSRERKYTLQTTDLSSLATGNYQISIETEDRDDIDLTFLQLTDFCFDTIVILDTNLEDVTIKDVLNNEVNPPL